MTRSGTTATKTNKNRTVKGLHWWEEPLESPSSEGVNTEEVLREVGVGVSAFFYPSGVDQWRTFVGSDVRSVQVDRWKHHVVFACRGKFV